MIKRYACHSWIDPRIEIRVSSLEGHGSFARTFIKAGEIVTIWGGSLFTIEDLKAGKTESGTAVAIAEDLVLASPVGTPNNDPAHFLNHSCDPNVWMRDEVTLVARRDIQANEELTADYAMWEWDEHYVMPWRCSCGSSLCRGTITGRDWRIPALQERYRGHFSSFLNERIRKERAET